MCDRQEIRVNGVSAKAGHAVAVGDRIEIFRAVRATTVEIVALPSRTSSREQGTTQENFHSNCYRILDEAAPGRPVKQVTLFPSGVISKRAYREDKINPPPIRRQGSL